MGILEPITHKNEIESLLEEASSRYDSAKNRFDSQKKKTTQRLEHLGKVKINAWAKTMNVFIDSYHSFENTDAFQIAYTNTNFRGVNEEPQQMITNISNATMTAGEIIGAGVAALGTGALVGIASYGGAMMFGTASTGTSISTLTGAARRNATLAWFGGGSLQSGGHGMAGGRLVLAGIVIAPIIAVATLISGARANEKLEEAKRVRAEAVEAAQKMDTVSNAMKRIAAMSDKYTLTIKKLCKQIKPFINKIDEIKRAHGVQDNGVIDVNELTSVERKLLHVSWIMIQNLYQLLSASLLTESGDLSSEAEQILNYSKAQLKQVRIDCFKMTGEETVVGDIIWAPYARKMIVINFIIIVCLIIIGCVSISNNMVFGISCFIASLVAFPIFIKYKNLPQSKMYIWRIIRAFIAVVLILILFAVL